MSQFSSQVASSSQAHSNESSLHYHRCWWAWCRHNFYSRKELVDHVNLEHVQKARPVRLADISVFQQSEDGYWDSLEFSDLPAPPLSWPLPQEPQSQEVNQCEGTYSRRIPWLYSISSTNPLDHIPSSLPSPPASTPHDIPGTPIAVQKRRDLLGETQEPKECSCQLASPQISNGLLTPMSKRIRPDSSPPTLTFTFLSSELSSPHQHALSIPESPCFDYLVTATTKRHLPVLSQIQDADEAMMSPSDESSQESVFNQLTQGIDDEEDNDESDFGSKTRQDSTIIDSPPAQPIPQPNPINVVDQTDLKQNTLPSTPLQIQTHQLNYIPHTLSTSPRYLQSPTYPLTTPVRQSWYQPRRRRSSRMTSTSEGQGAQSSPATSPIAHPGTSATSSVFVSFRTAAIQPKHSSPVTSSSPAPRSPFHLEESQSQSQNTLQTDSTQVFSYPPIQTQAPYHSPSFSQSWQD
ncbi:hypothetical protein AN958_05453 [Leucoagaricus sp. SymC.cos]|nr:hypothetical protein AN958_05453 [Leucoagaricus sp. SymC.cos]